MTTRKAAPSTQLKIDLNGDRRLAENVILEVKAAARRVGLEIANVDVIKQQPAAFKVRKPASPLKSRGRA